MQARREQRERSEKKAFSAGVQARREQSERSEKKPSAQASKLAVSNANAAKKKPSARACKHAVSNANVAKKKPTYKPGSVVDSHSSRAYIAVRLKQPTRAQRGPRLLTLPSDNSNELLFGLAPSGVYLATCVTTGAVRSYRTLSPLLPEGSGLLSAALAVGLRRPDVIWHSALWSPDFPPLQCSGDCPVGLSGSVIAMHAWLKSVLALA